MVVVGIQVTEENGGNSIWNCKDNFLAKEVPKLDKIITINARKSEFSLLLTKKIQVKRIELGH
jgi:hypothetical protein